MIYLYPSNRLENLSVLLHEVLKASNQGIFEPQTILASNNGMEDWIKLELARQRGISMNLKFQKPQAFFWDTMSTILARPLQLNSELYSREVLRWRILKHLKSRETLELSQFQELVHYIFDQTTSEEQEQRKWDISSNLADQFEQIMIFRPDWIRSWERESTPHWQALLWKTLQREHPDHFLNLFDSFRSALESRNHLLPDSFCLFGFSSLPPHWLHILKLLGEHSDIHIFFLNPCREYWGDLYRNDPHRGYDSNATSTSTELNQPLLAFLGKQGQEFLSQLQDHAHQEIPSFDEPPSDGPSLQLLQHDLLTLRDSRQFPRIKNFERDDSLIVTSSHNPLREVQTLHDWLLDKLNRSPDLYPHDIAIMCPEIETYAPFVHAVFNTSKQEWNRGQPSLPCSISDQRLGQIQPAIRQILKLLDLKNSRMKVSTILDLLKFSAIARNWGFQAEDIEKLTLWVQNAGIHWGLDQAHKSESLEFDIETDMFTWQQGLKRLLLGYAYEDEDALFQDQLLLHDVEGQDALLLGKLITFIDALKDHRQLQSQMRTVPEWREYSENMVTTFFNVEGSGVASLEALFDGMRKLVYQTQIAGYSEKIHCLEWKVRLESNLEPSGTGPFIGGSITFCSLIPMRSIPFKIIAVLGLNQDQYPRKRPVSDFDLLAADKRRVGDRNRTDDDCYLFLEAVISARQSLYLSYQGRDPKTNDTLEPSTVLTELMDYLKDAYGWDKNGMLRQASLQPFHPNNYRGQSRSFDPIWFRHIKPQNDRNNLICLDSSQLQEVDLDEVITFFNHPLKHFAQSRLGLFFRDPQPKELLDLEPFCPTHLQRYQFQNEWVQLKLNGKPTEHLIQKSLLSGQYPESKLSKQTLEAWRGPADTIADLLSKPQFQSFMVQAHYNWNGSTVHGQAYRSGGEFLFWRLGRAREKDLLNVWIHHLFFHLSAQSNRDTVPLPSRFIFLDPKTEKPTSILFHALPQVEATWSHLMGLWQEGLISPLFLFPELGQEALSQKRIQTLWDGNPFQKGMSGWQEDPYIRYFFSAAPICDDTMKQRVDAIWSPISEAMEGQNLDV